MIPVLPAFYFGTVEHYRVLAKHPKVIIDIGEHYERQSYRNRTTVIGPNGINDLVVQIARKSGEKMPMCEVGLSYKERWPQQHDDQPQHVEKTDLECLWGGLVWELCRGLVWQRKRPGGRGKKMPVIKK